MKKNIPNLLTFSRIIIAIYLFFLVFNNQFVLATVLIAVSGLTDFLDGYIARNHTGVTALGVWLDPLADKFLLGGLFTVLYIKKMLPFEIFSLFMIRDFGILAGYLYLKSSMLLSNDQPVFISKMNTVFQFLLGTSIIFSHIHYQFVFFEKIFLWTSVLTTITSGIAYMGYFLHCINNRYRKTS